jgi:hypothetical protein
MELTLLAVACAVAWWTLPVGFDARVIRPMRVLGGAALVRVLRGER